MFWIIPLILLVIFIPLLVMALLNSGYWNEDKWLVIAIISGIIFLFSAFLCPGNYLITRNDAWRVEQYYESVILPNVVEETDNYVIVSSLEAGVWQAGEFNLYSYNSYVRTTLYWQEVPVIGWHIYPVPEHLKYVKIQTPQ